MKNWKEVPWKDKLIIYILIAIASFFGIDTAVGIKVANTPERQISAIVKAVIGGVVKTEIAPLEKQITEIKNEITEVKNLQEKANLSQYRKTLADIEKQGTKLENAEKNNDFNDIYLVDFSRLFTEWIEIPKELKMPIHIKIIRDMEKLFYKGAG